MQGIEVGWRMKTRAHTTNFSLTAFRSNPRNQKPYEAVPTHQAQGIAGSRGEPQWWPFPIKMKQERGQVEASERR